MPDEPDEPAQSDKVVQWWLTRRVSRVPSHIALIGCLAVGCHWSDGLQVNISAFTLL